MLEFLVILALRMALRPWTFLKGLLAVLLIRHLIGLQYILKLVDLVHIIPVDALELTCLEALQEVVGFVFCLFEVVVFS